jgi:hypothetical protein
MIGFFAVLESRRRSGFIVGLRGSICSARASEFAVALPVAAQPKEVFGDAPSNENRCTMIQK